MKKVVSIVGLSLCIAGLWTGASIFNFQKRAVVIIGTVTLVQELQGPPKPRQKTPLHVSYKMSDGSEHSAITHLPLLQEIRAGDKIRLLVDPQNPRNARSSLASELWALPLTYLVGGLLLMIVGQVLQVKRLRG